MTGSSALSGLWNGYFWITLQYLKGLQVDWHGNIFFAYKNIKKLYNICKLMFTLAKN